ncbi:hypothetical protein [Mucilaginibacter pallidiroseus]|nr:hypothetical protein [Mucilaginibacter pallidiroseus]
MKVAYKNPKASVKVCPVINIVTRKVLDLKAIHFALTHIPGMIA